MNIIGSILRAFMERIAKGKSYAELRRNLAEAEVAVLGRIEAKPDTPRNREIAAHIIGIERWGQQRLRVLLGASLQHDEYDGYRPDNALSLKQLADEFRDTRQETLALVEQLQDQGVGLDQTSPHNQMGPLKLSGWLAYLRFHGTNESKLMR